ncbi:MAG: DRTGG domain-containing protein [Clostridiales bacterium]|nr:DRTGG domain-containing protein [Clostridiales bacterium]
MTIEKIIEKSGFKVINEGKDITQTISKPFCCDLLSIAMSRVPANAAWVTVMGNINTLAVATLTEASCVILAEGIQLDAPAQERAKSEGITVLSTEMPIFEAASLVQKIIDENTEL